MTEVTVNFANSFELNLGRGIPRMRFEPGVQQIDEALADHWYVQANMVGATKAPAIPGMPEFLAEDTARATELQQMLEIANRTAAQLQELRDKASSQGMREINAATRRAQPINESLAERIRRLEDGQPREPLETAPETKVHAVTLPQEAEAAEGAPATETESPAPKPRGRAKAAVQL
jgi:hypothetical protein